jgi:hypothetical protein
MSKIENVSNPGRGDIHFVKMHQKGKLLCNM